MGKIIRSVLILLNVEFFFVWIQSCEFTQPTKNDLHKRFSINETMKITFYFNETNCSILKDISIDIAKDRNDTIMCTILFEQDETCIQTDGSDSCSCEGKSGIYLISRKMKRNDSGLWKFMTIVNSKAIDIHEINVTVNYPANVVRLEVDGQDDNSSYYLVRNQTARIVCVWENGNPPVTARLLDKKGEILRTEAHNNLTYTYMASNCNEDTSLTCEANGSRRNVSSTLMTICPPAFVNTSPKLVMSAKMTTFRVHAHTTDITECSIYRLTQSTRTSEIEDRCHPVSKTIVDNVTCQPTSISAKFDSVSSLDIDIQEKHCSCRMEGTIPYLNLTLQLHNFIENDDGQWMLVLSNPGGCNKINFTVHLFVINTATGNETPLSRVILAVTMASIFLIVVFLINFAVKKKGKMVNEMYEESEEFVSPVALSPNNGVDRNKGTVVDISDVYSRVMKKTQGQTMDSALNTEPEGILLYTNPFYEVVSAKEDMETHKTVKHTIEEVIEYANPFYGIKNCTLGDQNIKSNPQRNGNLLAENGIGETDVTVSTDTYSQSDNIDVCSQPPVLHIQSLAEARQNTYMGVSIERQDTRVFQRSAQPLIKVQE